MCTLLCRGDTFKISNVFLPVKTFALMTVVHVTVGEDIEHYLNTQSN